MRIVIIGGGIAGLELATSLGKQLGKTGEASITLIDKYLTHIWKPLLHEIAVGSSNIEDNAVDYIFHGKKNFYRFQLGTLIGLNRQKKEVIIEVNQIVDKNNVKKEKNIAYDILIITIGSISNNYNIPGTDKYCYYLDSLEQATKLQQDFLNYIVSSNNDKKNYNIGIIGAGATGVELAAEVYSAIHEGNKYNIQSHERRVNISIIESCNRLLPALPQITSHFILNKLKNIGINILLNEKVIKVTHQGIHTASGTFISAEFKIWSAGIRGESVLSKLDGLKVTNSCRLLINNKLQTTLDDSIYAIGDCSACFIDQKNIVPARAQAAHQESVFLKKQIIERIRNKRSTKTFHYHDNGSIISLGGQGTILHIIFKQCKNIFMKGISARLIYRLLYKIHQVKLSGLFYVLIQSFSKLISKCIKAKIKLH